jgi:signal peptidase II
MQYFCKKNFACSLKNLYIAIIIVILDQISKTFLIKYLPTKPYSTYKISENFDLVYVWNYGISFGAFGNHSLSNILFFIINFCIIVYLTFLRFKINNKVQSFAYDLLIGGAVGNLIDRILRGGVFDFIYFHYKEYGFPIFNLADMFISIGVAIIIYKNLTRCLVP